MQVNIFQAKHRLSQLIKLVRAGHEVAIANRGKPVARLVPAEERVSGEAGAGDGHAILHWLDRHPLPAYAHRSAEELDKAIDEARADWD
jgi:prevent-host-death family protein